MQCNFCHGQMCRQTTPDGRKLVCLSCNQQYWRVAYKMIGYTRRKPTKGMYPKILKALEA